MELFSNLQNLKCPKHPKQFYQYIHTLDTTGKPLNCMTCLQEKGIQSFQDILSIPQLMDDDSPFFQSNFPPLNDKFLYENIRKASQFDIKDDILQQIDKFFSDMQKDIEKSIEIARTEVKQQYQIRFQIKNDLQEIFNRISFKKEMKRIFQQEQNIQEKISKILKKIEQQKSENTSSLRSFMENKYMINTIEIPSKQIKRVIKSILDINFFTNLKLSSNLIRRRDEFSQKLEITKSEKGLVARSQDDENKMAYLDFILDPNKYYIFRIQIRKEENSSYYYSFLGNNEGPFLLFGLIENSVKDSYYLNDIEMSYSENSSKYGMGEVIKGNQLQKGISSYKEINRQFEMRIQINQKIVRVADYPNYFSVCQLDDEDKIDLNKAYRFGIQLSLPSSITITEILEVDTFDGKM